MSIRLTDNMQKNLDFYCRQIVENSRFDLEDYDLSSVKRGLRNPDGTGVTAGVTNICNVEGYYIDDGERIPKEGRLNYRGIDLYDFVGGCTSDDRFGYEELVYLLLFGVLPTQRELDNFCALLALNRELPFDFVEDVILKSPNKDIMNAMARSILALNSYDRNPDDLSIPNVDGEVQDPYGYDYLVYMETAKQLDKIIRALLPELLKKWGMT